MLSTIDEYNQRYCAAFDHGHMPTHIMLLGNILHSKVMSANADSNAAIAVRRAAKEARQQRLHESKQMLGLVPPGNSVTNLNLSFPLNP